ncbi:MbnH family di-heme enzyme [Hydrocarboniphaga sp.]|uniref:MbnH family di-heme enzyme n=1 Tax=Hydrocarboniphaga sp. TaxID=2033016 RepID=UPI003D0F245B
MFDLPSGFPQPKVASDDPMSEAKVALGRQLFYDQRVAFNGQGSCVSCHEQRLAFSDGRVTAIGPAGDVHPRNAMSLTNAVYNSRQNWANPNIKTLREQALVVLLNQDPVELGWQGHEQTILDRLRADADYQARFKSAFPDQGEPFTLDNVARALAAFTATLISGRSAYDRYHDPTTPDRTAMSDAARRGEALFFSEQLECNHCHNGFNLANSVVHAGSKLDSTEYKNNALYNIAGPASGYPLDSGNYPTRNQGLYEFTLKAGDMGRFRPPTLRNIALTAPYMHDGSIASLRELIVDHYAKGGRVISEGAYAGDGSKSPNKDALMIGFTISEEEVDDLLAFFDTLTDWEFICDPRHADPFGKIPMNEHCKVAGS